jgi:hypothetical protein
MNCDTCGDKVWVLHPTKLGWICFNCFQNKDLRKGLPKTLDNNGKSQVHISVKPSEAEEISKAIRHCGSGKSNSN